MTPLFVLGDFTAHSGETLHWKIECDALTDPDIECLAAMLAEQLPPFQSVYGIPTGGTRIADAMRRYATQTPGPRLIMDDVLTNGQSMATVKAVSSMSVIGAVLFARGPCPTWITPLFTLAAPR